jgi:hypothetical protein
MHEQKTIALSLDLVNGVLQYLGTQPFKDVFQLVNAIQQQAQGQLGSPDEAAQAPSDAA